MSDLLPESPADPSAHFVDDAFENASEGTPMAGPAPTPLAVALLDAGAAARLVTYRGVEVLGSFSGADAEFAALTNGAGVCDHGWLRRMEVRGADQVRWLNGMLTNNMQTLSIGSGNYNFVLNAQGRIQGDAYAFRQSDHFLLETSAGQFSRLYAHLDRYIIMDDVELLDRGAATTSLGLIGPEAPQLLRQLGLASAFVDAADAIALTDATLAGLPVAVSHIDSPGVPHFVLSCTPENVIALWTALQQGGAAPVGLAAFEMLRVLQGTPLVGVDIGDRDLPQEANQPRALNFSKGCYLGQEIVERIRSRATVHRQLRQFALSAQPSALPAELTANGQKAGRLTSVARIRDRIYALGMARVEAAERRQPLEYEGGSATVLDAPPALSLQP